MLDELHAGWQQPRQPTPPRIHDNIRARLDLISGTSRPLRLKSRRLRSGGSGWPRSGRYTEWSWPS